ncbi:hypothetical protein PTTG_11922 [Puccinia triticina 1-1 BBBD Race 1]|uniref:Hydrophobin n=2 Tax=Puccinia triticina TaxID=208348 RepID=A0A180G5F7_PUCT1|nr:uncharacterized protein PtA15_5A60 [Puccinia triticina]OAV87824.1 hypothetical protein PTTG_11922 [Puccinia triticina 1-1 BBBD Race 1]WAQ84490.1 hypothetical protein PtA15_5A60 [Puccinia triticina]WAR57829.1 hypothetical protein PtB15_5B59 [Puccinia triticina]
MISTSQICLVVAALLLSMVQPSSQGPLSRRETITSSSSSAGASFASTDSNGNTVSACQVSLNGVTVPCMDQAALANVPAVITNVSPLP